MRTTVRLPDSLHAEAKRFARKQHTTVTELMTDGLRLIMKSSGAKAEKIVPLILPVCSASLKSKGPRGQGLPPGASEWSAGKWEEWCELNEKKGS